jgi:hypothetical protein
MGTDMRTNMCENKHRTSGTNMTLFGAMLKGRFAYGSPIGPNPSLLLFGSSNVLLRSGSLGLRLLEMGELPPTMH